MKQQNISVNPEVKVVISSVPGDLRVAGWERSELMIKSDGDMLDVSTGTDPLTIACDEDLIVYVPRGAALNI